jgi:diguanylate cyclase (GGDEF)-like protein
MSDAAHPGSEFRTDVVPVRALRDGVLRGVAGPATIAVYALATPGGPNRPLMLLTLAAMAANIALAWVVAERIIRSRHRFTWQFCAILVHIAGMAVLIHSDGGVAGPLGALAVFALLFFAATLPRRAFVVVCLASGVAYWTVAQVGTPPPPGYAETMVVGTGGVAYLCHRYATALVTLRRRLADMSRTDPLTGCLNRRGFDERLQAELDRNRAKGGELTLVVADLDRFKEINDTYGHLVGDNLLGWTGRTLGDRVRGRDVVGRLGGDEFAMILVDTGAEGAALSVRRFREALVDVAPGSFGVATHPVDAATIDELKVVADRRLYEDKTGRDRSGPRTAVPPPAPQVDEATARRVSRFERRGRTVLDLGMLAAACNVIGLGYTLIWSESPHQAVMAAVLCVGLACGLVTAVFARQLSRTRYARWFMTALSFPEFAAAGVAVVLDGGAMSPLGLGMLAPLPLVAFGSPPRHGAPIVGSVLATYVGIGIFVGDVDPWYVAMYIAGALTLAVTCGIQGHSAAMQRKLLTRLSRVDPLTDCLNRRGFEELSAAELPRLAQAGGTAHLLVLDLDGFKQLNDTRGHAAGDALLTWIGETLHATTTPQDVVGRLGGDEFVVLAPDPTEPVQVLEERLRAALASRTEVSIGTATLGEDGTDFQTLYARADTALYRQKAARRQAAQASDRHRGTADAMLADLQG